jgi:outer membrane receptor protein involved in Fe transport
MFQRTFWRSLVAVLTLLAMIGQGTWVLAGTTGQLSGTLVDAQSGAPIADARVTATSPSQQVTVTTNSAGRFSFVSLAPDTYSVTSEKPGYDAASVTGVTIQADQSQTVEMRAPKRVLTQIGTTRARANSDLVKAGTTADVYSVNAATQTAASALGGGGALNQAYSAIASVPGVYVPQGQSGWAQSVYVRGGDYTQLGYEFDGVPIQRAFDQYPGGTLSALGQQELQIYTGAAPAEAASTGLAGFINQVIRTGTNPPYGNAELGIGSPTFYHKGQLEFGGANAKRTFSYYAATAGYDQAYRLGSQFNGAEFSTNYGAFYNILATNCGTAHPSAGCYANTAGPFGVAPIGPNGFVNGPFDFGSNDLNADRESVINLHFGLPKKNGSKDDIQVLYQNSWLRQFYNTGLSYMGAAANDVANGTVTAPNGTVYPTCDPASGIGDNCALFGGTPSVYNDFYIYTGPVGGRLTTANLTQVNNYTFPNSVTGRPRFADIPGGHQDTYDIRTSIEKLQYQRNINDRSFLRLYGYEFYSDWLQNGATSFNYNFVGGVSPDYELATHTRGLSLSYVNQITDQHLLNFTGTYTYATTYRFNNAFISSSRPAAVLVNSLDPYNGLCYRATLAPTYCGGSPARYTVSQGSGKLVPSAGAPVVGTEGALTCGTGPCEYLVVGSGLGGNYNTVAPRFSNFSLTDDWHPTSRITLNLGLRYDIFRYDLPQTDAPSGPLPSAVPASVRTMYTNSFNLFNCYNAGQAIVVSATSPGVCPAGSTPIHYTTHSPAFNQYTAFSPRLGATYQASPNDVFRLSYGKYVQPASSAFQQYNAASTNVVGGAANQGLLSLGVFSPTRIVKPETSNNLDGSWEHQFKGDTSFKLSPFYRTTQDEIVNVLIDPKTNFVSGVNVGNKKVYGLEFEARKGDFTRNGLAAQFSYTYTNGRMHFNKLPNGLTVVDAVNNSIATYNSYTSFCASHATAKNCTDRLGNPTGVTAAPCYNSDGSPNAGCTAGSIANPYWNAPPQPLFNPNDDFVVYNQLPGAGAASVASSYIIPHVATLIVNYKRDRWAITPSFQLAAGGQYGSPVNGVGIDPASGCSPLASGAGTAGDPRYPYGAAGGSAYDASTCPGGIVAPNRFTGRFDNFGAFREPTQLVGNLQISYQASKNVTLRLTGTNLINSCFGGSKEPWNVGGPLGCWYTGSFPGDVGNFYNPGDRIQPSVQAPYGPSIAQVFQQTYGGQQNPINIFLTATLKLF